MSNNVANEYVSQEPETSGVEGGNLHLAEHITGVINRVGSVITPVWPLKDYVAVNPYAGMAERAFLDARSFLRIFSDCETLMPVSYYAEQFRSGKFTVSDIEAAIEELKEKGFDPFPASLIQERLERSSDENAAYHIRLRTVSENLDELSGTRWTESILNEICKVCSAYYDEDQGAWASPWKSLPLYQAWRQTAVYDRNLETLGLRGVRGLIQNMPHSADAAIVACLRELEVPPEMWETVLLCQAFSMLGWSAWTRYQAEQAVDQNVGRNDFADLLAIRLAYEVCLSKHESFTIDWESYAQPTRRSNESSTYAVNENAMMNYTLLRASEIAFRKPLLQSLATSESRSTEESQTTTRKLAQMVFCIDVRSERLRRCLESLSSSIETFGFAGFFAMPIQYARLGECQVVGDAGDSQVPVLLKPKFQIVEGFKNGDKTQEKLAINHRSHIRAWRKLWKGLQYSAVSCFSFVETMGLLHGGKLLARTLRLGGFATDGHADGVAVDARQTLAPTLKSLAQQGISTAQQVDLAYGMLKNMGLTSNFARLVVLCGHACKTENNPLQASLDCGACGGHSGEPNAKMAALLLNQQAVREGLQERGVAIPEDTHFVAALHNTTTDNITYFVDESIPETHRADIEELKSLSATASLMTAEERLSSVASPNISHLLGRSKDWSEVRPEWGLAGNAAFIACPRSMTKHMNLDGRAFLHSYDHDKDETGSVLETIMTAPMIVANWINMQYYASTVDNRYFGSGSKTIHNVVGRFGVLAGASGDLQTGLPLQSLHTGKEFQHCPMRLLAVIAAPRKAIDRVIDKHEVVSNLLSNNWMHLVAIEAGRKYRLVANGTWQELSDADDSDAVERKHSNSGHHVHLGDKRPIDA